MAQVVDRAHLGVRMHDPLGQFGQLFFQAKIGGHIEGFGVQGSGFSRAIRLRLCSIKIKYRRNTSINDSAPNAE